MSNNVIALPKTERFAVYCGELNLDGELKGKNRIGSAYMKPGAKKFRLKLWLMSDISYFVAPDDKDPKKYVVLIPDQYRLPNGELRTSWHRIGVGEVTGTYIKIRIHLIATEIFLSMFPDSTRANEIAA